MTSLAGAFDGQMMKNLNFHAAWLPIISPIGLGYFGKVSNGIFQPQGNIADHSGVTVTPISTGAAIQDVSFESSGIKTSYFTISGGIETPVTVVPNNPSVQAAASYSFANSDSYKVLCTGLYAEIISNDLADYFHDTVWPALNAQGRKWDTSMKIIYQLFYASNYILMASSQKSTNFTLSGSGSAIFEVGAGSISSSLSLSNDKNAELNMTGYNEPGIIGYSMMSFKGDGTPVIPSN